MEERYIHPDSAFYNELESLSFSKRPCEVIYLNNESRSVINGKIVDLVEKEGAEYLEMDSGLLIRLDKLLKVNGVIPARFC